MKAVILAGGRGTRLGQLTEALPKPMVPICGKPLLEHQLAVLRQYEIDDIILSTGFHADAIESYFGDGAKFGVRITYAREDRPLGTAGALKSLQRQLDDDFLVVYGDVVFDMNLSQLRSFHREHRSAGTLVLHPNDHPQDSDLVEIDWGSRRVIAFHAKPHASGQYYRNLVNAGVYILAPTVLDHLTADFPTDLGRDVFPQLVGRLPLFGYVTGEYLKDMGTPDRLRQVADDVASGKVARFNNAHARRAVFLDRDGVLNRYVSLLHRPEQIELLNGVAEGIKALNQSDYLSIVVTNQPVVARGMCSIEEIERIHGRLETLLGEHHAKIDAIYFCPHHPDRGFPEENPVYKVACDCRKPGTGMVIQAAREYNIALEGSFLIGDRPRDIECGQRAGMKTIVMASDEPWPADAVRPDFTARSFNEAVTIVLQSAL